MNNIPHIIDTGASVMNKQVAWLINGYLSDEEFRTSELDVIIPLYTHPVKELHLSLQKEKETGELLAVTYTDDEHRIVEVLWQRPPVKELTQYDRGFDDGCKHTKKIYEAEIEALKNQLLIKNTPKQEAQEK